MTPPDDRSGQYGVPYPGTGHDAFGAPGVGPGQPYGQPAYGQPQFAQQQPQYGQPSQSPYEQSAQYGRHYGDQQPQRHGYQDYPGPEAFPEQAEEPGHVEEFDDDHDSGPLIRPFAMTGGRTRPRYELALEALVSANVSPDRLASMLPEHQRICTLCTEVKSVAEVSALLNLPLGVARILVADLAEAGLVAIHQPAAGGESGNQPDVTLLERVLSGLRKL
ncbi:hypothetical protein F4556_002289 [Kitasatospora gansuensis]|uniref:DUF742 domain-containing protein n=1 Tax=Kitasatospora gansuensis TaxID=258050 RepID=A0A7W7WHP6_9ACTN|nr:DUF742 domain-containing protein [Kitasatospora gansuensis]MBB4946754.1 hypothetical protein [Kitasatospora gansuensis]